MCDYSSPPDSLEVLISGFHPKPVTIVTDMTMTNLDRTRHRLSRFRKTCFMLFKLGDGIPCNHPRDDKNKPDCGYVICNSIRIIVLPPLYTDSDMPTVTEVPEHRSLYDFFKTKENWNRKRKRFRTVAKNIRDKTEGGSMSGSRMQIEKHEGNSRIRFQLLYKVHNFHLLSIFRFETRPILLSKVFDQFGKPSSIEIPLNVPLFPGQSAPVSHDRHDFPKKRNLADLNLGQNDLDRSYPSWFIPMDPAKKYRNGITRIPLAMIQQMALLQALPGRA
jgi:hypothetical protein